MSDEPPEAYPPNSDSGGKGNLYANRVTRLKIASMIENAQSTQRHPYVSIIRGRDLESVNSFADGVIEILRLHGNHIVYPEKIVGDGNGKTRANSENIIYVIDQNFIEQRAREGGITFPTTSANLIRSLGLNVSQDSKVIIKVTTEFSRNIITDNSSEDRTTSGKSRELQVSSGINFSSTVSTLSFYFGAVSFAAAAAIQAVLIYTQLLGPSIIYQLLSLVGFGIFFIITLISYALRYLGYKTMNIYEKILTVAGGILFIAATIIAISSYTIIHISIPPYNPTNPPALIAYSLEPALALIIMTIGQITLFSARPSRWLLSVAIALFAALPLTAQYFLFPEAISLYESNYGAGFYFIRTSLISVSTLSVAISMVFAISDAALAVLFFHIGKSGFNIETPHHEGAPNSAETGA